MKEEVMVFMQRRLVWRFDGDHRGRRSYLVNEKGMPFEIWTRLKDGNVRTLPPVGFHGKHVGELKYLKETGEYKANFVVVDTRARDAPQGVNYFLKALGKEHGPLDICFSYACARLQFNQNNIADDESALPMLLVNMGRYVASPSRSEFTYWNDNTVQKGGEGVRVITLTPKEINAVVTIARGVHSGVGASLTARVGITCLLFQKAIEAVEELVLRENDVQAGNF